MGGQGWQPRAGHLTLLGLDPLHPLPSTFHSCFPHSCKSDLHSSTWDLAAYQTRKQKPRQPSQGQALRKKEAHTLRKQPVSVGSKRNTERKSNAESAGGKGELAFLSNLQHLVRLPLFCRCPSTHQVPTVLFCWLVLFSRPEKEKEKKFFRLQKHFLADDKPPFQWAVHFHISLAADILTFFFFKGA